MAIVVRRGIDGHRMDFVVPFLDKTTYIYISQYVYASILYAYVNAHVYAYVYP